jgi:chitodextrinase
MRTRLQWFVSWGTRVIVFVTLFVPAVLHAQLDIESGAIDVDLIVEGCNNNLVCEPVIGEDTPTCPLDCPEPPVSVPTSTDEERSPRSSSRRSFETDTGVVEEIQTGADIRVEQFSVDPRVINAVFRFSTNTYTIASVRVGETSEHELRAVAEFGYRRTHEILVSGLQPSTTYMYEVYVTDPHGNLMQLRGTFTTRDALSIPSIARPLLAKPTDITIKLTDGVTVAQWVNPMQSSTTYVHVVRTTERPANTPEEGITVYKGDATEFTDTGLVPDATYYYTFFANHGGTLFSDGVSIEIQYRDASETTEALTTFTPRFNDSTFNVFDFSFIQHDEQLAWKDRELSVVPFEPITLRFKKQDFFGPLEDVYIDVTAYNQEGEVTDRRFHKFGFRTELHTYQTILDGFAPNQTLLVTIKIFRADGVFEYVLAKANVGAYSSYGISGDIDGVACRVSGVGFEYIKNVLMCTMPWPIILLVMLLVTAMHYMRKRLI